MLVCPSCDKSLPITAFRKRRNRTDGARHTKCRNCQDGDAPYDPARQEVKALKSRYGMTPEDRDSLLQAQNGRCAICNTPFPLETPRKKYHIDHNHKTGEVRGILCENCNRGLGMFQDNPDALEKAANYLRRV